MPPVPRSEFLYEDNLTASSGGITAVNGTSYTDRASWIAYLNNIDESLGCDCYPVADASVNATSCSASGQHGHGIGCNTGTYTVNATHCQMYWDIYEVEVCDDVQFDATTVCPGTEYYWNINDASGFVPGTQFSAVGQNVTHEFRDLGIFKVVLTVKNIYGNVDSHMILVNVVKP